jgi:hypothetical protein
MQRTPLRPSETHNEDPASPVSAPPHRIGLPLVVPLLGLILVAVLSLATLAEVRVGGPQDDRVHQALALSADTQIPSQNLAEVRGILLALGEADAPASQTVLTDELARIETAYGEGHAYWDLHLTDPSLRAALLVEAHESAAQLFRLVHEDLLPAVERNDRSRVSAIIHNDLLPLVERHTAAAEVVASLAARETISTENRASDAVELRVRLLTAIFVVLGVGLGVQILLATRRRRLEALLATAPIFHSDVLAALDHELDDIADNLPADLPAD